MFWMLRKLYSLFYGPRHKLFVGFTINFLNGITIKGYNMSITIRNDQEVTLTPTFKDKSGNAVTVLGSVPVWSVTDENIAALAVAADGLSAVVTFKGPLGEVLVNMVVDADPDADVLEVTAQQQITVVAGMSVDVTLSAVIADVLPAEVVVPVTVPVAEVIAEPAVVVPTPVEEPSVFVPTFPPAEQTFEHTPEVALVPAEPVAQPVVVTPVVEAAPVVEPVAAEVAPAADPVAVTAPEAEIAPVEVVAVTTEPAVAEPAVTTVAEQTLGNPAI